MDLVGISLKLDRRTFVCFGCHENRDDRCLVTRFMEILEIQGVIPNLINRRPVECGFPNLELDHKHNRSDQQNRIYPSPHPRNIELQKQRAGDALQ